MSKLKVEKTSPAKKSNNFLTRDVKNVARNGSATIAELREFMHRMQGKRPAQVLGEIAQSGLAKGLLTSAVILAVVLVVFTVGPFLWRQASPPEAMQSTLPAVIAESVNPNTPGSEDEEPAAEDAAARSAAAAGPAAAGAKLPDDPEDILKQINANGEKNGTPTTNPFGGEGDELPGLK